MIQPLQKASIWTVPKYEEYVRCRIEQPKVKQFKMPFELGFLRAWRSRRLIESLDEFNVIEPWVDFTDYAGIFIGQTHNVHWVS